MADSGTTGDALADYNESPQDKLRDLTARATAFYAVKKYEEAAECYSEATELQAEVNGEMSEDNADLLFFYGRCLFHVAQKSSTVLGGTAASVQLKGSDKKPSRKRKANGNIKPESSTAATDPPTSLQPITETSEPADVVPSETVNANETKSEKPYFHIEGDAADWDDSDQEEEGDDDAEGEGDEDEEVEDDFNNAYEILDFSRVLYLRKLDSRLAETDEKSKPAEETRILKTKISDIYDLQAEINLEGEKYAEAETDLRSCLELKKDLYPLGNAILAECHYKLSLALEAASQVQQRDQDGNPVGEISIDWDKRKEAAAHQEEAIKSCKLRIEQEQKDLEAIPADKQKDKQKAQENIDDVMDIMQAMEQRLEELKKPPVSIKAETEKDMQQELMGTVLGQMLGAGSSSMDEQKAKLAEVIAGANDLTGMVKRKKPKPATNGDQTVAPAETAVNGKGKRKIEEVESDKTQPHTDTVKKVRIEDVID
ncbi:hypothetical protein LTR64_002313 [Lithohypha guttulata]|uniref:uncharacterized protein n=1 Tax=Lithohypha guttulata TaxID=1690604 RepID=UPI002DDDC764|nr:hypothetical protein LTR51_001461 [Lithohypha guttulata]